ncbi:hypothetical protein [Amycolatopsis nigrescens]|uniref:hypothetical protein n=1 Tax=Amycolatopsis nigrescens TaxID=381445 RepID=UPI0003AAB23E|nr:hypothetical protein [Amycolatopsis nigrescens]
MNQRKLTRLAGTCDDEDRCATVFATDRGTVAVQGDLFDGMQVSPGEAMVEIPKELLLEAARAAS